MDGVGRVGAPRSASVVAYYGTTGPSAFVDAVSALQADLGATLGEGFLPRPLPTAHSTLVGLEVLGPLLATDDVVARLRGDSRAEVARFAGHLRAALGNDPVTLQLGGFADADLGLTSRGQRLYARSVTVDRGQVVLIGWPVDAAGGPVATLDGLRRDARRFGIEHRYPLTETEHDPDAHVVVGEVAQGLPADVVTAAVASARAVVAARCCRVPLRWDDLAVVVYDDPRLPLESTTVTPLSRLIRSV